jgi:hypothetical protein
LSFGGGKALRSVAAVKGCGRGRHLKWQFHFGDSGTAAFNDDGTFNAEIGHVCHVEHTYQYAGSYVATVSVTDQHLEDQAHEVAALARDTMQLTIRVAHREPRPPPGPRPRHARPGASP